MAYYRCGGKPEQEKTVTAGTSQKTVTPDSGKTLKKVIVDPTPTEEKTITAGTSPIEVTPSSGKHLSKVTANPTPSQSKSVTPSASQKIVTPDSGKLLNKVTVAGDSDLVAGNIKKGVNIFGVNGSFDNSTGLYAWKKSSVYYKYGENRFTHYNSGAQSDKTLYSYVGNFASKPTMYRADSYELDPVTGVFTLINPVAYTDYGTNNNSEYFTIYNKYIMFGKTQGNEMWLGLSSSCYGCVYTSGTDYWLVNRYSQEGLCKIVSDKGIDTIYGERIDEIGSIAYYSSSYTFDETTGKFTLVNPASFSSHTTMTSGVYYTIGSPTSDTIYYQDLTAAPDYLAYIAFGTDGTVEIQPRRSSDPVRGKKAESALLFVDYVVSNSENAYPDKAVHTDGYYYEKVVDGITPEMLGCTKMAIDTFVFTVDTAINAAINHSLGEAPKYLFILIDAEPASVATTRVKKYIGFGGGAGLMGYILYNVTSQTPIDFSVDDATIRSSKATYYWYGGIKYTLITMA